MIFPNRTEAGRMLVQHLINYANRKDVIVLGIPHGGVPVAFATNGTVREARGFTSIR